MLLNTKEMSVLKNIKLYIFCAVSLICIVAARFIQIVFLTDTKTGFFIEGLESTGTLLSAFVIIVIAAAAALSLIFKSSKEFKYPGYSAFMGFSSLICGLAQIAEPFFTKSPALLTAGALVAVRDVFIVISGAMFCYLAYCLFTGVNAKNITFAVFVISWVLRLLVTFISFTRMSNISDNIYDVIMLVFTLSFFLLQGKLVCNIKVKNSVKAIRAVGIAAIASTAAAAVPSEIVILSGIKNYERTSLESPITGIFTAVYIAACLFNISKSGTATYKPKTKKIQ